MRAKPKSTFVCSNCGSSFASWFGKCPDCDEWNSLTEFKERSGVRSSNVSKGGWRAPQEAPSRAPEEAAKFVTLKNKKEKFVDLKISTGFVEMDRVLGGGLVKNEVILVAGEPGVGKSTLLLSLIHKIQNPKSKTQKTKIVYISSEEEASQIQQRAQRIGVDTSNLLFSSAKNIDSLLFSLENQLEKESIELVVFDSLQGLYTSENRSLPGSVAQLKEVLLKIVEFSKRLGITSLVVGHVTKGGDIAGPKMLEHMVDCVLFMEGDKASSVRILRSFKNRFGPTDEVGFFTVNNQGMTEVKNPSQYFLDWEEKAIGKASVAVRQGVRVVFATVETLVVTTSLTFPKRVAKGVDFKRQELILAILKKYLGLPVDRFDIYSSVSGGLRIDDPLADLGIAAAIYSSLTSKVFSAKHLFLGEVGLLGNIRETSFLKQIAEQAKRLGFTKIYSKQNLQSIRDLKKISK